ncbi:MAG: vitamin B12 dependent-methionine synthase activation domain-containing protein [Hespellia sp.]|nr:vitamin B12 dependent-methionine synthase activation domain-containing protein [Hespellia sp.]
MNEKTREAIRYLGYGKHAVDGHTLDLIAEEFEKLEQIISARFIYRIFDVRREYEEEKDKRDGNDFIVIESMNIRSRGLIRNLKGCRQVVLFAATLGIEVDRRIHLLLITDMARAVIAQACAAALLEEYCDQCQEKIGVELEAVHQYLRPRFSPGYGDFPIEFQADFFRLLDCPRKIGLSLTDSFMMTPTKSVTAVIGISDTKEPCHTKGCEACGKMDCQFRRDQA